jgi:hypothetical protein
MVIEKIAARAADLVGSYGTTGHKPELVDAVAIATARCTLINHELVSAIHTVLLSKAG